MIKVEHLTKLYGPVRAVDDVSFEVEPGQILGFLGPNGAGKTTAMRVLTSFIPATSGEAWVDGHDVRTDSLAARASLGYLPESVPLYPDMRVREYLNYRAALQGVESADRRARIARIVERCGLGGEITTMVRHLSKGFRQRLGLAASLVHDPPVLILDEPTVGLDPGQIREVRGLIKELGEKRTVILSTHILPEVEMVCDRVAIIHEGRLAFSGSLAELGAAHGDGEPTEVRLRVRGDGGKVAEALERIPGVRRVAHAETKGISTYTVAGEVARLAEKVSAAAVEAGGAIRELAPAGRSLEDLFIRFTTREAGGD